MVESDHELAQFDSGLDRRGRRFIVSVFRNRFGQWRAGWRLALYLLCAFVIGKAFTTMIKPFVASPLEAPFASWAHSVLWLAAILGLVLAAMLLLRYVDRRPVALLGLGFESGWLREAGLGVVAGAAATGLLAVVMLAAGWVDLALTEDLGGSLAVLPSYAAFFTLASAVEELLFRGYPLQVLAEGSRRWLAGLVLCLIFAWAHVGNPDISMVGIGNIFLAAVVLTILYFQTRRLWLPIAFHMSWNFSQSWLWGFDVSGIEIDHRLLVVTTHGPQQLTGGGFGLEGSVLTLVLFVLIVVWLLAATPLRPVRQVRVEWQPYPRGFGLPPAPLADKQVESMPHEPGDGGDPVLDDGVDDSSEPPPVSGRSTG
jgi:hypothetical protein